MANICARCITFNLRIKTGSNSVTVPSLSGLGATRVYRLKSGWSDAPKMFSKGWFPSTIDCSKCFCVYIFRPRASYQCDPSTSLLTFLTFFSSGLWRRQDGRRGRKLMVKRLWTHSCFRHLEAPYNTALLHRPHYFSNSFGTQYPQVTHL